jgi:hypothetical protein
MVEKVANFARSKYHLFHTGGFLISTYQRDPPRLVRAANELE